MKFQLNILGPEGLQPYMLSKGTFILGRQAGCEILLNDPQVSRRHAEIECTATECRISDLGSSNGTRVNNERLHPNSPVVLMLQDAIRIGPFELTYLQVEEPETEALAVGKVPQPADLSKPEPQSIEQQPEYDRPSRMASKSKPPAPPSQPPIAESGQPIQSAGDILPPGLSLHSQRLLGFLPGIYHTDFMARFLGIFEAILAPIEWNIDNFDLYLDPGTAPYSFIPWLAGWFEIIFDPTWSEKQRRTLLNEAHQIYARRGTSWALSRILEIYTGRSVSILDTAEDLEPFTFKVILPFKPDQLGREMIERLIDANKPAHTTYMLEIFNA